MAAEVVVGVARGEGVTPETRLRTPQGEFEVRRLPATHAPNLRAWDAADEYVLSHVAAIDPDTDRQWVVVNDTFGALAVALAGCRPAAISDSVVSQQATRANLALNRCAGDSVQLLSSLDEPPACIDALIVRVPRALALLEDQLHRLRPALHEGSVVLGAGMTRTIHTSTLDLFHRLVGPTSTTRAVKKARLITSTVDAATADPGPAPGPSSYRLATGEQIVCHANVFSAGRLDQGTALLVEHLPTHLEGSRVVDLGCGSGILGVRVAALNPSVDVEFVDSSFMAIASAEATWRAAFGSERPATFSAADGLDHLEPESVDLVVNNPPFHADRSMGDAVAWQMFIGARRCLRPGGELLVVGNRHLGYHAKLKRIFGNCATLASTPKFVALRATKGGPAGAKRRVSRDRDRR